MNVTHENPLGLDIRQAFPEKAKEIVNRAFENAIEGISRARIIHIDGRQMRFESNSHELTILINAATPSAKRVIDVSDKVILDTIGIQNMQQGGNSAYTTFKDSNGLDLAYLDNKYNDLYIPYDIFELGDTSLVFFENLMNMIGKELSEKLRLQHTWGEGDEQVLKERIKKMIEGHDSDSLERKQNMLKESQEGEKSYREALARAIKRTAQLMDEVQRARSGEDALDKKIAHEFAHIVRNPDVKSLEVRDDKFVVHTNRIIGTSDVGKHYDFGEFSITYRIGNTGIAYEGNMPRQGYWTPRDPHPHVSGDTGNPCLGNISEAIAQLSSMNEYASLVAVAIEFLKAANTSDPAGRNVVRWNEVDMEGNLVQKGVSADEEDEDRTECDYCGEFEDIEDTHVVYDEADDDDYHSERTVCSSCLRNHYEYHDGHDQYIHTEAEVWS